MLKCIECNVIKQCDEYNTDAIKGGLQNKCKSCVSAFLSKYYEPVKSYLGDNADVVNRFRQAVKIQRHIAPKFRPKWTGLERNPYAVRDRKEQEFSRVYRAVIFNM